MKTAGTISRYLKPPVPTAPALRLIGAAVVTAATSVAMTASGARGGALRADLPDATARHEPCQDRSRRARRQVSAPHLRCRGRAAYCARYAAGVAAQAV